LTGVSLSTTPSELLVVVGPSGSGKSTLLRCIAGLESIDSGSVVVNDRDVTKVPPRKRDLAMVFQDYALYPHMDVRQNIAFPLRARRVSKADISARVTSAAEMLDIDDLLDRRPGELSGGERRRVSLARAVVRDPAAFLMDEPLSSLDSGLRHRVLDSIRTLQQRLGVTTIYVTHDQTEAMTLGHRLVVLREGRVEQIGSPLELYDSPRNSFVATFIGREPMNLWPADASSAAEGATQMGVRSEHLRLVAPSLTDLKGVVSGVDHLGPDVLVTVDVSGREMLVRTSREGAPTVGAQVGITFESQHVHRFSADGNAVA
jgi:multiple sugar transport system ATP-binding protein